jgi:hypothetical protein
MRLGFPASIFYSRDASGRDVIKALGFTRGLGAGSHKYHRRVRKMVGGKLRWVYYYDDPRERARWLKHAAAQLEGKREEAKELEEQHKALADFNPDHPDLKAARKALQELTIEYVHDILAWDKPPNVKITDNVMAQYHKAIIDLYGKQGDPDDPHGQIMSVMRATELAFKAMPPVIKKHFSGAIKGVSIQTTEEYQKAAPGNSVGYCKWPKGGISEGSPIFMDMARCQAASIGRGAHMKGGLFPVEVLVHEMAHAIHNQLGAHGLGGEVMSGWKGKTWADFEAFMSSGGRGEAGVTDYAEKNNYERWAESFTAAVMYPKQLAKTAPRMYEWMRSFLGTDAMRPISTNKEMETILLAQRDEAIKANDIPKARELSDRIDKNAGVLDMADDDTRLQWWKSPETRVQKMLRERRTLAPVTFADAYKNDPPDEMATGKQGDADRFYEMNVGGRTIFMRVGASSHREKFRGWDPTDPAKQAHKMRPTKSELKEIYDTDGNPLTTNDAWWYLQQDKWTDDHPEVQKVGSLIGKGEAAQSKEFRRNQLWEKVIQVSRSALNPKAKRDPKTGEGYDHDEAKMMTPAEISLHDFRLRSGTFTYDRWDAAGHAELEQLRAATDPEKREAALAAYLKKQPNVERVAIHDARGRVVKSIIKTAVGPDGGAPVPVHTAIRYINDNPDGTKTVIRTIRDESGDFHTSGKFYIESPLWRQLLTPKGEDIRSASHLAEMCRQAATERRRAWVSVLADTTGGATPHYYHVQIEFDGRGQPRVIGDEWKRRLGKKDPRLDDLLKSGRIVEGAPGEVSRPTVRAENIRIERKGKKPAGAERLPKAGDRVVLRVKGAEMGRIEDKDVVARLVRIMPAKKAGEVPSPPGWDRMPEGAPELPREGDPAAKLTGEEKRLIKRGLLPDWYGGSDVQRAWKSSHFDPAYQQWMEHKEEQTAQEWPARYVFIGEVNGGASGRTFTRYGDKDAMRTTRKPITPRRPLALKRDTLVYVHEKVDPITGMSTEREARIILPSDGTVTEDALEGLHGVVIDADNDRPGERVIRVNLDGFARLREHLGGVSMTGEAEQMLRGKVDTLREAAERALRKEHVIELDDIDPAKLKAKGVGLVTHLPDGSPFVLADHQKELVQLLMDNGGRALGAHFMGTGKTVTAVVATKMAIAMRDPEDESKPHPNAPKRVLVVAPLSTVEQWRQAYETFDEGCHVVGAGKGDIPADEFTKGVKDGIYGNSIVVCGPEYYTIHQRELLKAGFDGIVADEAHLGIKNEKAQRNASMEAWNSQMKFMFLLTGTPITTSPADILEYVKILSKGEQWAGMTRAQFIEEYLEESPVPAELGIVGRKGPLTQVKASKRAELAAIVAQWTHVAAPKDVRGKALPSVRIEENKHAEMTGIQSTLYALRMAALSDADKETLRENSGTLAEDEMKGLGDDARKQVAAAKAIANCAAYKPQSEERWISTYRDKVDEKGAISQEKVDWQTFDPEWLTNKAVRKKFAGRWPTIEETSEHTATLYGLHLAGVIGTSNYALIAGTKITEEQLAKMRADGWPRKTDNPEAGPLGIRCRGIDTPAARHPEYEDAIAFQREYANTLASKITMFDRRGKPREMNPDPETAFAMASRKRGIDEDKAREYLGVRPDPSDHHTTVSYGGVTVKEGENWISDSRGSLHLLYRPEDWDADLGRPLSAGGFEKVDDGVIVNVKRDAGVQRPKGVDKADWDPPQFRYDASLGEIGGKVAVIRQDTGQMIRVPKEDVSARVSSLMDPGMRKERAKADVAMTQGNAKAEELRTYIQQFHADTEPGPDGARQMVLFANGILEGCRSMEATLRTMGFKDVNESIAGSPHFDKEDAGPAPNGKYFVTYIGSTYTGDRDINVSIFQKHKDRLGRDTAESLFVQKTLAGKKWRTYPSEDPHPAIRVSQWTFEQRERIRAAFGVKPPEAFFVGDDGTQRYFYGTKRSADIMQQLAVIGDPVTMEAEKGEETRRRITSLKAEYESIVRKEGVVKPPLDRKQTTVFNNCEIIVCSDAAQVGMNLGNAAELVMYDSLASPMAEWQRITRAARMLPPAVEAELIGTEDAPGPFAKIRKMEDAIFKPAPHGTSQGIIPNVVINTPSGRVDAGELTFTQALNQIQTLAQTHATMGSPEIRAQWQSIANRAGVAKTLGTNKALEFFREMSEAKVPGGIKNLLEHGEPSYPDPTSGTYAPLTIEAPTEAVRRAINSLSDQEKAIIAKAGFVMPGADGKQGGSLDPASVYLAMRAQDVLDRVEKRRPEIAAQMRAVSGGKVVTDGDVTNAIIDELSPGDRAVLKEKKYLVNVRRIGVSAYVPEIHIHKAVMEDPITGEEVKVKIPVFTGYAKQHPIQPEAMTRATGRARLVSVEAMMKDIQDKLPLRVDLDYETDDAASIANASRMDVVKAEPMLVFSTALIKGAAHA